MTDIVVADSAWKGVEPGTEGIVEKWLVAEGERVDAGQVVASAMLIKATIEVVAPARGTIERILVAEEATFARGQPLAHLREG